MTPQTLRAALAGSLQAVPAPRPRNLPTPAIETLTMNGFRILNERDGLPGPPERTEQRLEAHREIQVSLHLEVAGEERVSPVQSALVDGEPGVRVGGDHRGRRAACPRLHRTGMVPDGDGERLAPHTQLPLGHQAVGGFLPEAAREGMNVVPNDLLAGLQRDLGRHQSANLPASKASNQNPWPASEKATNIGDR